MLNNNNYYNNNNNKKKKKKKNTACARICDQSLLFLFLLLIPVFLFQILLQVLLPNTKKYAKIIYFVN